MIDVEEWCANHKGRKMRGYSGLQMEMDCPMCHKARHLYVALEKRIKSSGRITYPGDFVCFKCDYRGRFVKLYGEIEGLTWKEARMALVDGIREPLPAKPRFMTAKAMGFGRPPEPDDRSDEPSDESHGAVMAPAMESESAETLPEPSTGAGIYTAPEEGDGKPHTPLPEDFIPCFDGEKWRIPQYLKDRRIEKATIASFNLGYCEHGQYGGRIILPISCPEGSSFTARAIDSDAFLRYLAGPGAGRLLFGWEQAMALIAEGAEELVVNEGPFDTLSVYQAGMPAVALMGLRFKAEQVAMLASVKVKRIVMMLDTTATKDAVRQAPELGSRAMIADKIGAKDANEANPISLRRAVQKAIPVEAARTKILSGTLAKLRDRMAK